MSSLTTIRSVVTGHDVRGRSAVQWDSSAPNQHEASLGSGRGYFRLVQERAKPTNYDRVKDPDVIAPYAPKPRAYFGVHA